MTAVPAALRSALHDAALVVVQAPPGYGKTTTVRAALAGDPSAAWYDAQPWEAGAFVAPLIDGVRTVRPDVGRVTLGLADEGADAAQLGATFARELEHVALPLRIVVDDAHVLGAEFGAFARALVRRMPPPVSLVLLARAPLDVGLAEAVAGGRGVLIDAGALRFDAARVRAAAEAIGAAVDDATARALVARTDGWPIAVALALRAPASPSALLDELVGSRLAALGDDERALLDAALAYETIEPSIAAPGDATFAARLAALASDGALAAPVQQGFRVHPLVREALARRLDERALALRHAAAAAAYGRARRLRPALFHLERGHDPAADADFLREHAADAMASGLTDAVRASAARVRALSADAPVVAYVDGLLAKARGDDAREAFGRAAAAADGARDAALAFESRLQLVETQLAHGDAVDAACIDDLLLRARDRGPVATARAGVRAGWSDALAGRFAGALARIDGLADAGDPAVFADIAPLAAYARHALGDFEAGERVANAAIETWSASDDLVRYAGALNWGARFALLRGETNAAYELAREAQRIGRPFALRAHAAALHVTLAEASLHVGDRELARREARSAMRAAGAAWYARDAERTRAVAERMLARADALDGKLDAARAATRGADPLSLADAAIFAALAGADDRTAVARAREAVAGAHAVDGADAVNLADAAETLDMLDAFAGRDAETVLRTGAFDALVARRAEPVRLARLAAAARDPHGAGAYARGLAAATAAGPRFETQIVERLAALRGAPVASADARSAGEREPLTAREREILDLLAAGLTNREIAQRLIVSSRTVETHVARVTAKLGVSSRARAVARASGLGLIGVRSLGPPRAAEGTGGGTVE